MKQKLFFFGLVNVVSSLLYAQAAAPVTTETAPVWMQFVPILVIFAVFYFFMIRPQSKKMSEQKKFIDSLKNGDQVITQSGILGKITGLNENLVTLEISNGVNIKIMKSQVLSLQAALQTK